MKNWIISLGTLALLAACTSPMPVSRGPAADTKANAGKTQAQAKRMPWGGYWWSMLNGELALGWEDGKGRRAWSEKDALEFDKCIGSYDANCVKYIASISKDGAAQLSPLMKFDLYVRKSIEKQRGGGQGMAVDYTHATKAELAIHYIGNNTNHRYWNARGYSGKCIGWALSTMDFDEPTKDVTIEGIVFHPADIKGILATIYNGAQFFVPDNMTVGNAYRDLQGSNTQAFFEDVYPHDFVKSLASTIGKGVMMEADLEPRDGVWNYPIYRYEMEWTAKNATTVSAKTRLFFVNDEVGIDDVFSKDSSRKDIKTRDLTFDLTVPAGWNGDLTKATGGKWTGDSVNTHPDAIILGIENNWRNTIYQYSGTQMKQEVNFALLKRQKVGGKWVPTVDMLLRQYYAK